MLLAHRPVPAENLKDLIALAKAQPGKINFGSAGVGSAPHLAGEQLRRAAGIDINHVPYKGGGPLVNDLLAGHLQLGFTTVPTMVEHVRAGTVRAIAVTGGARAGQLPATGTFAEQGLAAVDATPIFGLIAPAHVPAALIERYSAAASAAVRANPLRNRLIEMGFTPIGSTADEYKLRIEREIAKWSDVIRAGNIQPGS